jgi:plasmid stabilization system protein ParE
MPQVVLSENAVANLKKLYDFLQQSNYSIASKAIQTINNAFLPLQKMPFLGRVLEENNILYELVIKFGNSGYIALYSYDDHIDMVVILAIKHQREFEYTNFL